MRWRHWRGGEVVGGLAADLAEGLPIEDALSRANAAAAALVATPDLRAAEATPTTGRATFKPLY